METENDELCVYNNRGTIQQSALCTIICQNNQHIKLMINHFLITKHGEDNWKIPTGRGILNRYFCVYSTTGTNSEAEVPEGLVCLEQNWFTKAECTRHRVRPRAVSCLRGNQQQRSPSWNRIFTVQRDMLRITTLRLPGRAPGALRESWEN